MVDQASLAISARSDQCDVSVVLYRRDQLSRFLCSIAEILGAAIAYGYTSAATFMYARGEGDRRHMATGAVGTILATLFVVLILVPIPAIGCSMSHEGYICFIAWSALGLLFLFAARDRKEQKTDKGE